VNAILSVDLEPWPAIGILDDLIYSRRAITLRRFGVIREVDVDRD
jgi:hypothetical protein